MTRFFLVCAALVVFIFAARGAAAQAPPTDSPSSAYYQFLLGRHLAGEGEVEGAIRAFQRAASLDPSAAEIPAELASLYIRLNRPKDALAAAESAIKIDPQNFEANRVMGMAYATLAESARGDSGQAYVAKAVIHLEKAVAAPGSGGRQHAQLTLARLYLRQKAYDKSIELLTRLRSQEPDDLESLPLLAQAYSATGRIQEATEILERLVEYAPQFYSTLGDLYARQRRWKQAANAYREAAAVYSRNGEMKRRLAWALKNSGDTGGSLSVLKDAVQQYPDEPVLYAALAEGFSEDEQYSQALDVLDGAARKFPKNTSINFQRGAVLERQSRVAEAEEAFRAVIAQDPSHAPALNYLGYMLAERGERLLESLEYIKRAVEIDPGNGAYLDSLGWAYFKLNKLDLAESPLRRAAEQLQDDSVVQNHYGDFLYRLGRYEEAIRAWERALAGDRHSINPAEIEKKLQKARGK